MTTVCIMGHGIVDTSNGTCIPICDLTEKNKKVGKLRSVGRKALRGLGRALSGKKESLPAAASPTAASPLSPNTPRWAEIARLSLSRKSKSGRQKRVRFSFFLERGRDRGVLRLSTRSMNTNGQGILKKEAEKEFNSVEMSEISTQDDVYGVLEKGIEMAMAQYGEDSDLVREYAEAGYGIPEEKLSTIEREFHSAMPIYGDAAEVSYSLIEDSACHYGLIEETWSQAAHYEDSEVTTACNLAEYPTQSIDEDSSKRGTKDAVKRCRTQKCVETFDVAENGPAQKRSKGALKESNSAVVHNGTPEACKIRDTVSFASAEEKINKPSVGFRDENAFDAEMEVQKPIGFLEAVEAPKKQKKKKKGMKAFWHKKTSKYDSDDDSSTSPGTPRHVSDWQ